MLSSKTRVVFITSPPCLPLYIPLAKIGNYKALYRPREGRNVIGALYLPPRANISTLSRLKTGLKAENAED